MRGKQAKLEEATRETQDAVARLHREHQRQQADVEQPELPPPPADAEEQVRVYPARGALITP